MRCALHLCDRTDCALYLFFKWVVALCVSRGKPTMIAAYCRVSTEDQNLSRQVRSVLPYIEDNFDVEIDQSVTNVAEYVADDSTGSDPIDLAGGDVRLYYDRLTGTNTERDGYRDLIRDVEDDRADAVVADAVSRVSRSLRDLDATAERVVDDSDAELHLLKEGFRLVPGEKDPFQRAMFQLLGVFAELEAELAQMRAREGLQARFDSDEDYHHGRARLGFEKEDGELHPAPNYDMVCGVLSDVNRGVTSKRQAAKDLNTSRKTIDRCLEHPDLYGLNGKSEGGTA